MPEDTPSLNVLEHVRDAVRAGRARIDRDPFPYLVVEDALPSALYERLEAAFPSTEYIAETDTFDDNTTYLRTSESSLADPELSDLWRDFIETNTSHAAFEAARAIWGDDIDAYHPTLAENFGKPLDAFTTARRSGKGDSPENRRADVMLDCQFGVNTPVSEVGAPRGPHVDRGAKLFSALLYFRDEKDESTGGEYELFRLRRGPFPRRLMKKVPPRYIERVKAVPYRANQIVMWMNTPDAVHAVAPRSVTPHPRRYIAVSGECFGGAMPSAFFSHFSAWDSPLGRLRAELGI